MFVVFLLVLKVSSKKTKTLRVVLVVFRGLGEYDSLEVGLGDFIGSETSMVSSEGGTGRPKKINDTLQVLR